MLIFSLACRKSIWMGKEGEWIMLLAGGKRKRCWERKGLEISHDIFFLFLLLQGILQLASVFFSAAAKKPRGAKIRNRRIKKSNFVPKSRSCVSGFFFFFCSMHFASSSSRFPNTKRGGKHFIYSLGAAAAKSRKRNGRFPESQKKEKEKEEMTATSVIKNSCSVLFSFLYFIRWPSSCGNWQNCTDVVPCQERRDEAKKETSLYIFFFFSFSRNWDMCRSSVGVGYGEKRKRQGGGLPFCPIWYVSHPKRKRENEQVHIFYKKALLLLEEKVSSLKKVFKT